MTLTTCMWLACQLACVTCMLNASSMPERNVSTDSKEDDAMQARSLQAYDSTIFYSRAASCS